MEYQSRKLTRAALRSITAAERERIDTTRQEAAEARKWLLEFCEKKGFDTHSEFVKDIIKHHRLDPNAWRGSSWVGPGEIEVFLFEDEDALLAEEDFQFDVIEEIHKEDIDEDANADSQETDGNPSDVDTTPSLLTDFEIAECRLMAAEDSLIATCLPREVATVAASGDTNQCILDTEQQGATAEVEMIEMSDSEEEEENEKETLQPVVTKLMVDNAGKDISPGMSMSLSTYEIIELTTPPHLQTPRPILPSTPRTSSNLPLI